MTEERRTEAFKYIESQLKYGYVDLGAYDEDELEIIQEAINLLKAIDEFNSIGCTSFAIIPTKEKPIKVSFEGEPEIKTINCDNIEIKKELHGAEAERIINNIFGTTNIGALDCSDISDEELKKVLERYEDESN